MTDLGPQNDRFGSPKLDMGTPKTRIVNMSQCFKEKLQITKTSFHNPNAVLYIFITLCVYDMACRT